MMSKIFEFLKSPHILIALATGISIIVIAYFSKRVLQQEIGYLPSAIPPFIMVIYESLLQKYKHRHFLNVWYWVGAIFVSTLIVILIHL